MIVILIRRSSVFTPLNFGNKLIVTTYKGSPITIIVLSRMSRIS